MTEPPQLGTVDLADTGRAIALAAEALGSGLVVLVPTDTVYGLVCLPTSSVAVKGVFSMKQRPSTWRLPIIAADLAQARSLPLDWSPQALALAEAFWPGGLTIACGVLPSAGTWLQGREEAAVRVPRSPLIESLARLLGPLLMTSANLHGETTPHTVAEAMSQLAAPPAVAIDGGTLSGKPSTLVNVNLPSPVVEREGVISATEIEKVLSGFK